MEKTKKNSKKKIGEPGYLNEKCWLVRNLHYIPYKRCLYCELRFHNCLFLHYQIISLILIVFFLTLSFLINEKNSTLVIISVFTLVIIYGYFFNKTTDKLIQANFAERKTKEVLEELNKKLEEKIKEQTKDLRKAYETEKKARQELEKLSQAREQFILSSQHYFKTPLTSMIGYLDLLLEEKLYGPLPPKIKEKLNFVFQSTQELKKRIEESLNIAAFQVKKGILNLKETQLEDLVRKVVDNLKFEAEKKNLRLEYLPPNLPLPKTKVDPERMLEVFTNLIDNGIKHTPRGKVTVNLKYLQDRNKLLFSVKDTGIGISKEELPYIGRAPFERGMEAQKLSPLGKGIGLYLSKLIVEAHQGKLWPESEGKNKGSTFYVELPIKK